LPGLGWPLLGLMLLIGAAVAWRHDLLWQRLHEFLSRLSGEFIQLHTLLNANARVDAAMAQACSVLLNHNRLLTGADPRLAVCNQCLARFQARTADFQGFPQSSFACCPICGSDLNLFRNARILSLQLDTRMTERVMRSNETININGLLWLRPAQARPLPQFDEFVICEATDYDIEALITLYNSVTSNPSGQAPLAQVPCRIEPPASPGTNILRVLQNTFKSVESDGKLSSAEY
jgi:hypothetical protein